MSFVRGKLTAMLEKTNEATVWNETDEATCEMAIRQGCDRLNLSTYPDFDMFCICNEERRRIKRSDELFEYGNRYEFVQTSGLLGYYL